MVLLGSLLMACCQSERFVKMKNKVIISHDGRIEVNYDKVTHVCIAPNLYPLLQYLLLMNDDIVFHHTCFFVNEVIPENVRTQLPCVYYPCFGGSMGQKLSRRLLKLKLRCFKYLMFPFLKTADLFAYDVPFFCLLIGRRDYSLLADAPNWLSNHVQDDSKEYQRVQQFANSFIGNLLRIFFGDVFVHYYGNNKQCKTIYLTEENESPIMEGKEVYVQSLSTLWEKASDEKRQFVLGLFGIIKQDIAFLNSRPNMFFSQPLMSDCNLTETEYKELLAKIFNNYPPQSIIVKPHPRDSFDYANNFPDVIVFTKSVSSQLLHMMGVRPNKVITITSTAIEGFPESIECDFYGIHVHSKVEEFFGNELRPKRKVNYGQLNIMN